MIRIICVATVLIGVSGWASAAPKAVKRIIESPRFLLETVFDTDDGVIVCTTKNGVQALFRISLRDRTIRELGTVDADRFYPTVSDKGNFVAFCEQKKGEKAIIRIVKIDSSETRTIEDEGHDLLWPDLSADAKSIVYTARAKDGSSSIKQYYFENRTIDELTSNEFLDAFPRFSDDGSSVTFMRSTWHGNTSPIASKDYHNWFLYEIDLESRELQQRIKQNRYFKNLYFIMMRPPIHSDRYVVIMDGLGGEHLDFWVLNRLANYDIHPLALSEEEFEIHDSRGIRQTQMRNPVFAPSGTEILFPMALASPSGERNAMSELYLYDFESGKTTKLTNLGQKILDAAYSPDGSRIAFLADAEPRNRRNPLSLWIMNSDGSELKMLRDTW